jgi:hypothetical protein
VSEWLAITMTQRYIAPMPFPDPLDPHGPRSPWPLRIEAVVLGALMLFAAVKGIDWFVG